VNSPPLKFNISGFEPLRRYDWEIPRHWAEIITWGRDCAGAGLKPRPDDYKSQKLLCYTLDEFGNLYFTVVEVDRCLFQTRYDCVGF